KRTITASIASAALAPVLLVAVPQAPPARDIATTTPTAASRVRDCGTECDRLSHAIEETLRVLDRADQSRDATIRRAAMTDARALLATAKARVAACDAADATQAGDAQARLQIVFRSQPDPPRSGENRFEVAVKDRDGKPIRDAEVSLTFYMPAMPSMNMPEMRRQMTLQSDGSGTYRGTGSIGMPGRWEVTVAVSRGGQQLGSSRLIAIVR
ncbi:MAG: FixH family protein, partial [Vicinamibacterales bacterium]